MGARKKAKVGVLCAALKFCFGCFFQLQNRLRSRLQHKGMSMHHFLQAFRGEWAARRGSSPGYESAGVTRILQSSHKRRGRGATHIPAVINLLAGSSYQVIIKVVHTKQLFPLSDRIGAERVFSLIGAQLLKL